MSLNWFGGDGRRCPEGSGADILSLECLLYWVYLSNIDGHLAQTDEQLARIDRLGTGFAAATATDTKPDGWRTQEFFRKAQVKHADQGEGVVGRC